MQALAVATADLDGLRVRAGGLLGLRQAGVRGQDVLRAPQPVLHLQHLRLKVDELTLQTGRLLLRTHTSSSSPGCHRHQRHYHLTVLLLLFLLITQLSSSPRHYRLVVLITT